MREKKLYIYMRDEDYGKRMLSSICSRHHPSLRVEMMTEREVFWESRAYSSETQDERWLTDDMERAVTDRGDADSLILLDEKSDEKTHRISYLQKSKAIYSELLMYMNLSEVTSDVKRGGPPAGVYALYSPDKKADIVAPLFAQSLSEYGRCIYISLSEYPLFLSDCSDEKSKDNELIGKSISEVFFRLDQNNIKEIIDDISATCGGYRSLPGATHFRDVWDVSDADIVRLITRIEQECEYDYIVIVYDRLTTLLATSDRLLTLYYICDASKCDCQCVSRYKRYLEVEDRIDVYDSTEFVTLTKDVYRYRDMMEHTSSIEWLASEDTRSDIEGMWRGEYRDQ